MNVEDKLKELLTLNNSINTKILEILTYVINNNENNKIEMLSLSPDFDVLQAINSNLWPPAVDEHLIVKSNNLDELKERAKGIIEFFIDQPLNDKKFLDYGCGNGLVVNESTLTSKYSIGYDIKNSDYWNDINCTTDWNKIIENGPYDIVLAFDVLDHLINENPVDVLKKIRKVMTKNGVLYVRFHPFISRTAIHSYKKLNKAYLHLVLNEEQLNQLLPNEDDYIPNYGPTRPIKTYDEYIKEAGFIIEDRQEERFFPEEFFKSPNISKLIQSKTGFNEYPEFQLSLEFLDYKLINNGKDIN